ncbi:uncharacterized protein KGF55_000709 [Candida pseudojiufengensis]|uniref:uncharacterized protein n=1 Tax=Candida pseudojiufengensis TaxID=497109 RepID=UPI0022242AF1|nr:uncharacterized protein KGF55_000709 [Candida pseudojiufengensis]KAI5966400.1 hypothetical protein KGF55_000709 [Candida pseudojiufengensis]
MTDSYSYYKRANLISSANYLNSTLQSRAYIDTKLLFPSINSKDLIRTDQDHDNEIVITDELMQNDQTIIEVMMDLIQSIDKYRSQQKIINESITSKNNTIDELNNEVNHLKRQLTMKEKKNRDCVIERNKFINKFNHVYSINKTQNRNLKHLSHSMKDIAIKNKIDMKRKDLIIDELKSKLITRRNLSTTIEYGIPLTPRIERSDEFPMNEIEDTSNQITNSTKEKKSSVSDIQNSNNDELTTYIDQLSNTINDMTSENYKLNNLVKSIENYLSLINLNLLSYKDINLDDLIPNPTETINNSTINEVTDEIIMKHYNEIENCEFLSKPLLEEFNKFYNNLNNVLQLISFNNFSSTINMGGDLNSDSIIKNLTNDLAITKENLQKSFQTIEMWKEIAQKNNV